MSDYQPKHTYPSGMNRWGKVRPPKIIGYGGVDEPVRPSKPLKPMNAEVIPMPNPNKVRYIERKTRLKPKEI